MMGLEQEVKRHQTEANATTSHLPYAVTQIIKICGWSFTFNAIVLSWMHPFLSLGGTLLFLYSIVHCSIAQLHEVFRGLYSNA